MELNDHWRWFLLGIAGIASQIFGVVAGVSIFVAIRQDSPRFFAVALAAVVAAILCSALDRWLQDRYGK